MKIQVMVILDDKTTFEYVDEFQEDAGNAFTVSGDVTAGFDVWFGHNVTPEIARRYPDENMEGPESGMPC